MMIVAVKKCDAVVGGEGFREILIIFLNEKQKSHSRKANLENE